MTEIQKCLEKIVFMDFQKSCIFAYFSQILMKATLWPPITFYGPPFTPMAFNGPTIAPYGTLCHSLAPYGHLMVCFGPHMATFGLSMTPYASLWAPYDPSIANWLHLDNMGQIGGNSGPVEYQRGSYRANREPIGAIRGHI